MLRTGRPQAFLLNAEADRLSKASLRLLEAIAPAPRTRRSKTRLGEGLAHLPRDTVLDEATLKTLLATHLPDLGAQQRQGLRDALAVAAYHTDSGFPAVRLLLCDDAPQFSGVTEELALCWVHEGRHYKKLLPYLPQHQPLLDTFLTRFSAYYHEVLAYRKTPSAAERDRLSVTFDALFATATGYRALDERIAKAREVCRATCRVCRS